MKNSNIIKNLNKEITSIENALENLNYEIDESENLENEKDDLETDLDIIQSNIYDISEEIKDLNIDIGIDITINELNKKIKELHLYCDELRNEIYNY